MTSDKLKKVQFYGGDLELETAHVGDVQYVREHDGTWRYAHSWIKVPGARDLTLTEHFHPKLIVSADNEIERVVVSADKIAEAPDLLKWCLVKGTPIREDGRLVEVFVPIALWNEHDRIPGAIVAPEHSSNKAERELAEAERGYREADRALELAANLRAEVLRRYSEAMTRQEARAITDLSVGRIQQLIRSDSLDEIDKVLLEAIVLHQPKTMEAVRERIEAGGGPLMTPSALRERLRELDKRNLISVGDKGFRATNDGREALAELRAAAKRDAEVEVS